MNTVLFFSCFFILLSTCPEKLLNKYEMWWNWGETESKWEVKGSKGESKV